MSLSQESAETIALQCLAWLTADEELMPLFMGATGVTGNEMKILAQDTDFLGSVLDFLLMNDAWVIAFCGAQGLENETPMQARQVLPGGAMVNWT